MKQFLFTALLLSISLQGFAGVNAISASDTSAQTSGIRKLDISNKQVTRGEKVTKLSGQQRFRVSIKSNVTPVPLSQMHSWTISLETPEGEAIDDAKIGVYGSMPAHRHGLPTKPRVTENFGNGGYRVDGVKFTMPGEWELLLIITANGKRDKVRFTIELL